MAEIMGKAGEKVKIGNKPPFRSAEAGLIIQADLFCCERRQKETNPSRRECSTVRVSHHRFGKLTAGRFGKLTAGRFGKLTAGRFGVIVRKWVIQPRLDDAFAGYRFRRSG